MYARLHVSLNPGVADAALLTSDSLAKIYVQLAEIGVLQIKKWWPIAKLTHRKCNYSQVLNEIGLICQNDITKFYYFISLILSMT